MENSDFVLKVKLRKAVNSGTWDSVHKLFTDHQIPFSATISSTGNTALHAAAIAGRAEIVKKLVERLSEKDLEIKEDDGWTALMAAALTGITPMAKCMVEKNGDLVKIADKNGLIPVVVASGKGHRNMVQYLYENTPQEVLIGEKKINGATLLSNCIAAKLFDVALDLLKQNPHLAFALNSEGTSPVFILSGLPSAFPSGSLLAFWQRWIYSLGQLHCLLSNLLKLFGFKQIYDRKLIHGQALELLGLICKNLPNLTDTQLKEGRVYKAIFQAVEHGIVEFINEIAEADPDFLFSTDTDSRNIFQCAIVHRQEKIFSLIYGFGERKNLLTYRVGPSKNNMLHLAGMLAPSARLDHISGAALQMQRELQWFKEVERIVPPKFKEDKNLVGKTAHELFTENHKKLLEDGEKWMKGTASSCSVVAALVVTIMFAAAFTFPGGNNEDEGSPLFLKKKLFKIFIASDAISFFSSSTSVLIFLGILTSRYAEKYFLRSLPTKMIIGLTTLFISIATMISAFCAAIFLMLKGQQTCLFVIIILPSSVPVILFVSLQFPLLVEIFMSTYGPSIFKKKRY